MTRQNGFTLLELTIVIGLFAVLVVAGLSTYQLVTKNNKMNDAVRLTHIIFDSLRARAKGNAGTYGNPGDDLTFWLVSSDSIPPRYYNDDGTIGDPFSKASQITVQVDTNPAQFSLSYDAPPAYVPEILQKIDIAVDSQIVYAVACGEVVWNNGSGNLDPVYITDICGSSREPGDNSISIISR